ALRSTVIKTMSKLHLGNFAKWKSWIPMMLLQSGKRHGERNHSLNGELTHSSKTCTCSKRNSYEKMYFMI
ncbi:hypothetical protein MAR_037374, partial [Mya arenaria]